MVNHLGANSRGGDMTESQDDKYLTHNDHIDLLADRLLDEVVLDIGFASGSGVYTLSEEDWTENMSFRFRSDTSPSVDGDWTLQLPGTKGLAVFRNETGYTMTIEGGASPTGSTVAVGTGGRAIVYSDGENVVPMPDTYDIGFYVESWTDAAVAAFYVVPRNIRLAAGLPLSQAYALTPPGVTEIDRVISIQKNGSEQGTITFTGGDNEGTFSFSSDVDFAAGDRLTLVNGAPSPTETAEIAQIGITLVAVTI